MSGEHMHTTENFIRELIRLNRDDLAELAYLRSFMRNQAWRAQAEGDAEAARRWERLYIYAAGPESVGRIDQEQEGQDDSLWR